MSIEKELQELSYIAAEPAITALTKQVADVLDGRPLALCLTVLLHEILLVFAQLRRDGVPQEELQRLSRDLLNRCSEQVSGQRLA